MRRGRRGRGVGGGRLVGGWVSGGDGVGVGVGNGAVGGVRLGMGYGHGVWGTGKGRAMGNLYRNLGLAGELLSTYN